MTQFLTTPDYLQTLTAATQSRSSNRPDAKTVVEALLQAEKVAKQEHLSYPVESLLGQWQLWFTTGTRKQRSGGIALGKGIYLPQFVQAQIGFEPADASESSAAPLKINNQLQLGPIGFQVFGPARYPGKKNLLAFDFTQARFVIWNKALYQGNFRGGKAQANPFHQQPIAKLPFFAFFLVTDTFIAARGRGGGLAIWRKIIDVRPS
jgi:hypothetical protein